MSSFNAWGKQGGSVNGANGTSALTLSVDRATGVDRVTSYSGGDQSGFPFATLQSAINSMPTFSQYRRLITVTANGTAYAGYNMSGFGGSGDVVLSFASSAPTLTGPTGGAAGVGTTTTTCVIPTGSNPNWSSDTLRGYFIKVASSDSALPYIRPIKSKTNTTFTWDTAIPGFASGTAFTIVKAGTSLATGASTFLGFNVGAVVTYNTSPVRTLFAAPATSLDYGVYSTGNQLSEWHGAQLKNSANYQTFYSTGDLYSMLNDSYTNAGNTIQQYGGTAELTNVVSDGGYFLITGVNSALVTGDATSVTAGVPLTVKRCNNLLVGFNAPSNTASSAVAFDACTCVTLQGVGLTGGSNSAYGVEVSNGGQYNLTGATMTGASGNFTIDGSTSALQTWTNLASNQAISRYGGGTMLIGGSSTAEQICLDGFRIGGANFDVDVAQEQHGGRVINYGYFHTAAGASFDGLTAHSGGGQGSATPCGLGLTVFTVCAGGGDSAILNAGVIGGMIQIVTNLGAANLSVYAPSGGKMNATLNGAATVGPGLTRFFITRDDSSSGKDFVVI